MGKVLNVLKIIALCIWILFIILIAIPVHSVGILLALATLIFYLIFRSSKNRKLYQEKYGIPKKSSIILYYEGYDKKLYPYLYYWKESDTIYLCEVKSIIKNSDPTKIIISKDNIITFSSTGDLTSNTVVKGGGVSIGGAAVGAVVAGPVGAIIGGRKKVKSRTVIKDTRKTILKFKENGTEKTIILGYGIFNDLCLLCVEKRVV